MVYAFAVIVSIASGSPIATTAILPAEACKYMQEQAKDNVKQVIICIDLTPMLGEQAEVK